MDERKEKVKLGMSGGDGGALLVPVGCWLLVVDYALWLPVACGGL